MTTQENKALVRRIFEETGPPHPPLFQVGVRRPDVALSQILERMLYYCVWIRSTPKVFPTNWPITLATERTTVLQEVSKKEIWREEETSIVPRFPETGSNGNNEHQSLQVPHLWEQRND